MKVEGLLIIGKLKTNGVNQENQILKEKFKAKAIKLRSQSDRNSKRIIEKQKPT